MNWKDEFLKLYMSGQKDDFAAALKLKSQHIPSRLFRYRSLETSIALNHALHEICNGEIYLARPDTLNDPLEACSVLKGSQPSDYINNRTIYKESLRNHFDDGFLEKIIKCDNWYNELMHAVAAASAPQDIQQQEHIVNALTKVVMSELLELNHSFNQMIHKSSRIACLTTKSDNLPMWNHYAQGYKGICIEYNTDDICNIYQRNRLFPVYYVDALPDYLERSFGKGEKPPFGVMDYFLMHKLKDWSYEDEWRLIFNVGSWYFSPEEVPDTFWENGKSIMFCYPSRVILGPMICSEAEEIVREACKRRQIEVVKMCCTEYGLKVN